MEMLPPTALAGEYKSGTLLVPVQILWGREFLHVVTLSKCIDFGTCVWSGPMQSSKAERVGSLCPRQVRAAGVRTAGFGPEPH